MFGFEVDSPLPEIDPDSAKTLHELRSLAMALQLLLETDAPPRDNAARLAAIASRILDIANSA